MDLTLIERLEKHAEHAASLRETMVGSWPIELHDDLVQAAIDLEQMKKESLRLRVESLREYDALEEKLLIAQTAAKDTQEFRDREKKEYQYIIMGVRIAIDQMMIGLKGGQK